MVTRGEILVSPLARLWFAHFVNRFCVPTARVRERGVNLAQLFLLLVCSLFVVAVGATACRANSSASNQPAQGAPRGVPVMDAGSFINNLRAAGIRVERGGEVNQPFFAVTGMMVKIFREDVQIFQYPHAAAADAQAALISPDGRAVGTTKLHWIGPPHFYKKGTVLVLYVGDNDKIRQALEAVLGPQFAGY